MSEIKLNVDEFEKMELKITLVSQCKKGAIISFTCIGGIESSGYVLTSPDQAKDSPESKQQE